MFLQHGIGPRVPTIFVRLQKPLKAMESLYKAPFVVRYSPAKAVNSYYHWERPTSRDRSLTESVLLLRGSFAGLVESNTLCARMGRVSHF